MPASPYLNGAFSALALLTAGAARAAPLQVVVANVHGDRGHVRVDVCTEAEFLGDCAINGAAPAQPGETVVSIADVPPGVYAIQAYHDENDNRSVDRNRLGIPMEGFGFSHDASFALGPPKFRHARFTVGGEPLTLRVKLHHLPH